MIPNNSIAINAALKKIFHLADELAFPQNIKPIDFFNLLPEVAKSVDILIRYFSRLQAILPRGDRTREEFARAHITLCKISFNFEHAMAAAKEDMDRDEKEELGFILADKFIKSVKTIREIVHQHMLFVKTNADNFSEHAPTHLPKSFLKQMVGKLMAQEEKAALTVSSAPN